jgi:hypothetical protein
MSLIPEWRPRQDSEPTVSVRGATPAPPQLGRGVTPAPPQHDGTASIEQTRPYDVRSDANRERDDRNG